MTRKPQIIGLLLTALALGALGTSTASAATLFEAEGHSTVLTGTSHNSKLEITGNGTKFECTTAKFAGTANDDAKQVSVIPAYTGTPNTSPHTAHCNSSVGSITVDTNSCTYLVTGTTDGEGVGGKDAKVHLQCPTGNAIKITSSVGTTVSIPPQTPTGGVTFTNLSSHSGGAAINVTATATAITYSCAPTFICTLGGIAHHGTNADYTGTVAMTGYEGQGGPLNGNEFSEGNQVGVSFAGSAPDELSTTSNDVKLVGEDTGVEDFSLNAGTAECSEAAYTGTMEVYPASELTLTPAYAECDAFGFTNAEVNVNGCDYLFHEGPAAEGGGFEGTADIKCPEGKSIEIIATVRGLLKCRATIGTQSGLAGITYTNAGSGTSRDIKFNIHLEKVKYTQHAGEGLGKCTSGAFEDGKINGTPTVIGEHGEKQVGIWVQATSPRALRSEIADTTLIGEDTGTEKIELTAGTAECLEAGYKGTLALSAQLMWTLSPEFANCDAFGFTAAEVKWNGCAYELAIVEEGTGATLEGVGAIQCAAGKVIEVIAESSGTLKCKATIGTQSGLTSVTYTNAGSGASRDVKVDLSLSGVKYTQDAGEGTGKCTAGSFENGKIVGSPTVIGENAEKKQVGIWVE